MRSIENENDSLKVVLPNFSRPELDKRMLGNIIDLVTNFPKLNYSNKKDFLGEIFEKLLINFAIAEGIGPGQFYTPISVVKTLVAIIKLYKGRVYDLVVVLEDFLFNLKSIMFLLIILTIHGYI